MARIGESGDLFKCSFCGKSQKQVKKLIAGPGVYICDECIDLCNEIIEEEFSEGSDAGLLDELPRPAEIRDFLNSYVIGQGSAKKTLAVAVYNHYKRVQAHANNPTKRQGDDDAVELGKSNILLIGPTGCGKTYLAQTLAKMLNVPFAMADATALTEAGYVGEDVENILLKLIQAADFDVKKAETGIIYIDEIDKVARKSENPSSRVTCPGRVSNRPCSRSSRAPPRPCHPREAVNTRIRSSCKSTPQMCCSSWGARSAAWNTSLRPESASAHSVSTTTRASDPPRRSTLSLRSAPTICTSTV